MSHPTIEVGSYNGVLKRINDLKKQGFNNGQIFTSFNDERVPSLNGQPWTESSLSGFWTKYRQKLVDAVLDGHASIAIQTKHIDNDSQLAFLTRDNEKLSKVVSSIRDSIQDDDSAEITVKLVKKVLEFA